ncbi:HlyD family efflux transporter periplasmic adaptor subunit [Alcaligenaceae bacterium]|nr:HlyD family efflux transporter periplasmic adaptor subunit [Alcaligenaceae bacterium]
MVSQVAEAAAAGKARKGLPLREDLRLYEAGSSRDGAPTWVIQDPINNRFYRIGWLEYECLLRWPGEPARIAAEVAATTTLAVDESLVQEFAQFLEQNRLLRPGAEALERLKQQANAPGWRHWNWWLHHYLFVRVPLLRPDRLLLWLLPWVAPLFTRTALILLLCATGLGLVLVTKQWDVFTHSVMDLVSPAGIVGFLLALVVSKTLHEMGHALVATRQGLRVAHMGVAFVVLWPMLYTDTGESWRLRSSRQRLAISVAGISVELALAGLATLVWALLDDGTLRQSMLYLATTAWVLSLALNVSPFMRFDGYFILSDVLDFPNLHERAGAMARVVLRRGLLGLPDPYPEQLEPRTRRILTVFAFATWLYRLGVFLAIAWAVYTFFFKVLGIFLLIVEIVWFVLRPVWRELVVWKERWPEVAATRRYIFYAVAASLLVLLAMPWAFDVKAPAAAHPARQQEVYAPVPARVAVLRQSGKVSMGEELVRFDAPDLTARRDGIQATLSALERRLQGLMADEVGVVRRQAIIWQHREQQAELIALREEEARLRTAAEFEGLWVDVADVVKVGTWVDVRSPLGVLVDPSSWVVDAYVEQRDVARVHPGATARYFPQAQAAPMDAEVLFVDSTRSQRLAHAMLDGRYGGPIPTQAAAELEGMPVEALYRVRLRLAKPPPTVRAGRGYVRIEGEHRSLLWDGGQWLVGVLVRESGF